jgi:thymidylate synthase
MTPLALTFHDVNDAYCDLQRDKRHCTQWEDTRNGKALAFQAPVIVTYTMPYRRVLFDSVRDANPYFHYMEAIWMLAGDENVNFLAQFVPRIKQYSDDRVTLNGAYGFRWRHHFDIDQVEEVIEMLTQDRFSRRAVLAMWDPSYDLGSSSKDLPCNTHIYFRTVAGALDMTVCNRSNDLVWGMLGANVVHMSILHEYVANAVELPLGSYHQFTNNLHVYEGWEDKYQTFPSPWYKDHPTFNRWAFSPANISLIEAKDFLDYGVEDGTNYKCRILRDNAVPMLHSHRAHKDGAHDLAMHYADHIRDEDWRAACKLWLDRRIK